MTPEQEDKLLETVARLDQAICGNGVKGLVQRMDEEEVWRHTHPRVCPLDAAPSPRKVNRWNILFGIVAGIGVFGSLAVAIFK